MGRLFYVLFSPRPSAAVYAAFLFCGILPYAAYYNAVAAAWRPLARIFGRLYAVPDGCRGCWRDTPGSVYDTPGSVDGSKIWPFLPRSISRKFRASVRKVAKVAKVANQKVAKENQPHIVVELIVVKVAHVAAAERSEGVTHPEVPHISQRSP